MIRHWLKIVWNRKKANALILAEIAVSFLVLCIVFSVVAYYAANWRKPLGYDWRDVWVVETVIPDRDRDDEEAVRRDLETSRALLAAMRSHPEVVAAGPGANTPYSGSMSRMGIRTADGKLIQFLYTRTQPVTREILRLDITAGRWFEAGDEAIDHTPVVVNEKLARRLFGRDDPLNRTIEQFDENGQPEAPGKAWGEMRVVGVISDYRKGGELSDSDYAAFLPQNMEDPARGHAPWSYAIRLNPGTPAAFEEELLASLRGAAPTWGFDVESMAGARRDYLKSRFLPLLIGGTLAAFLIVMVGMGLTGVLWQNVTRRTQELGLRRALGATASEVRNQIIGEIVMLTTLALLIGTVLFLQVPLLGLIDFVEIGVYLAAAAAALCVLYPLVILCALYPGWLATRVEPSRALQYE